MQHAPSLSAAQLGLPLMANTVVVHTIQDTFPITMADAGIFDLELEDGDTSRADEVRQFVSACYECVFLSLRLQHGRTRPHACPERFGVHTCHFTPRSGSCARCTPAASLSTAIDTVVR